jgi:20S proteasome alpha/beta subunit
MTTIAYKDGIIAYDSRATSGDIILDDNVEKKRIVDGVAFFCCGVQSDEDALIELYFGKSENYNIESSAIVCDKGKLYQVNIENERLHRYKIDKHKCHAIGSGTQHAYTAMDLGFPSKIAVKMAIKRDWGSGGKIKTFKVK